jgi:Ca2+-binding RTX toxin-like protein
MKRTFLILLAAAAALMTFGASSALAANLKLNTQTGELSYETNDLGDTPFLENEVKIRPVHVAGWSGIAIGDTAWSLPNILRANVFLDTDAAKNCTYVYQGYDSEFWCETPKKITVRTWKGDDEVTVSDDLKIPTVLEAGPGIDWIQGGGGPDEIWGGCSNNDATCNGFKDTLHGGEGDDSLHGGASFDYLNGDAGNDLLDGRLSGDNLNGGDGRDLADYSARKDGITASLDGVANDGVSGENDFIAGDVEGIQGGSGKDTLYAAFLNSSILKGGPGDDTLVGYAGADLLMGEAGSDLLRPGFAMDNVYGGSDRDTVSYPERLNPITVTLDGAGNDGESGENDFVAADVENVTGGKDNDTLIGDGQANKLIGGPGNDTLDGLGGQPDELYGESGNDKLEGGPAGSIVDVLDGGADTDTVSYQSRTAGLEIVLDGSVSGTEDKIVNVENALGGTGDDKLIGTEGPNALFGGDGNDGFDGKGGDDTLNGGDGNDVIWGKGGKDTIAAGDGADTITGGDGPDWISAWTGVDTVTYDDHTACVTVTLDGTANDGAAGEGDNVLPGAEKIVGGSGGDTLTGDGGPNTIVGGKGVDTLNGLGGADQLDGGPGKDVLNGGDNGDTLSGGTDDDQLYGDAGVDALRGGPGNDKLHGGTEGDYADYSHSSSAVKVDLAAKTGSGEGSDTFDSIENAYGSPSKDALTGDAGPNTILGFGGNDTIVGAGGADHLFGADGNDVLRGDADNDELNGGPGSDTVDYSKSAASVVVDLSLYNASATGDGSDWLSLIENVIGSGHPDTITGSADRNVFKGGGGNDNLFGLGGDDLLDGQVGTDSLDGGLNVDKCVGEVRSNCEQ